MSIKSLSIIAFSVIFSLVMLGCGVSETSTTISETQITSVQETTTITETQITTVSVTPTQDTTTPIQTLDFDDEMYRILLSYCEAQGDSVEYPDTIENEILYKFLSWPNSGVNYVVVSPVTTIGSNYNYIENYTDMVNKKDDMIEWGNYFGCDFSNLYDQFLEINRKSSLLTTISSLEEGFFINYHGTFESYLIGLMLRIDSEESDYWKFMDANFPRYKGDVRVSMPAYDPETGYVLIYRSWVGGWLSAFGNLYLLQYLDGNLTEISYYEIWYS